MIDSPNFEFGHWNWCRQKQLHRSNCPCNDVSKEMPFVDVDWLLENDLRNIPRMQDLPIEAFCYPTEMEYGYFISHRWREQDHPDRTGFQLAVSLPKIWSYYNKGVKNEKGSQKEHQEAFVG